MSRRFGAGAVATRLAPAISLLVLLIVWQLAAQWLDRATLPTPWTVGQVLWKEIVGGRLPHHLGATLLRLTVSFGTAILLGSALGILLGRRPGLDRFFDQWLVVFLNIPALVTIILCYVWFGLSEAAAIVAVVVNKLPNVVATLREGARALDRDLLEMAQAYRFGRWKTLRHVVWPQLLPFLLAATRTGLALTWKIILVVELLGRSDGMGYQLNLFFQMFDVAGILAYTVAFILVIQTMEWGLLRPLDRLAARWRR